MAFQAEIKKLKKEKGSGKGDEKKKYAKSQKRENTKPKWFSKRPPNDELHKPREWKGVKWHYCHADTGGKCDGVWRQHLPSECKGKEFRFSKPSQANDSKRKGEKADNKRSKKKRTMKLERALQASEATAEHDSEENSTSEYDE